MQAVTIFLACAALAAAAGACAQTAAAGRGQLLYETHCIECHTTQMHWRDRRVAHDFDSLKKEVRRWQSQIGLAWSEDDVAAVAQHLNTTIYRFPEPQARR